MLSEYKITYDACCLLNLTGNSDLKVAAAYAAALKLFIQEAAAVRFLASCTLTALVCTLSRPAAVVTPHKHGCLDQPAL
jgi:hypothetical protein